MSEKDSVVICAARRTALGGLHGVFAGVRAPELGAVALRAALADAALPPDTVDQVLMGCVLPAGQGQAPARQAALGADLPHSLPCTTINKMCGSGLQAVILGHDMIAAGSADFVLAGGMESMTHAPYLLDRARSGYRMGHGRVLDHMFLDGLEDAYDKGKLMGWFAEMCAEKYGFTRAAQDAFALRSLSRAQAASSGPAQAEIASVTLSDKKGETHITQDEQPQTARPEKISTLKPAFKADGTVTAANASSISDGAAALLLARDSAARAAGLPILARIAGHSVHAQEPAWFTTAPIGALQKLLCTTGWAAADVDLYEINEAFAVVTMAAQQELGLPNDKVNIYGGACALGHPIGASGARILVTLLNALRQTGGRRGMATLCIGGGEAVALAVELL